MQTARNITGVLLLDKPTGISSNAALQKVKRIYQAKKAGHTGSLDPIATGMLPICLGEGTKLSQFLLNSDKAYYVTVRLGERTPTGDRESDVIERVNSEHVTPASLQAAMSALQGDILQTPPMYSALKHKGQPLYLLARQGIEIERAPRPVTIYQFELRDFSEAQFTCVIRCSKGTYVRTLIEDCAKKLGTVAYVLELRREYVSPYDSASMVTLETLERLKVQHGDAGLQSLLLPITSMVGAYPVATLTEASAFYFRMGQAVKIPSDHHAESYTGYMQVITVQGDFLGVGMMTSDGRLQPERLLTHPTAL